MNAGKVGKKTKKTRSRVACAKMKSGETALKKGKNLFKMHTHTDFPKKKRHFFHFFEQKVLILEKKGAIIGAQY